MAMSDADGTLAIAVNGELRLGSGDGQISTQNFLLQFSAADGKAVATLPIAQFMGWAAQALAPQLGADALPQGIGDMNIALQELGFDSSNAFQVSVTLGKQEEGKWVQCWHPIANLAVSVCALTISIRRTS
jgi:hypothetical protein